MSADTVIYALLAICVLVIFLFIFSKPLMLVVRFLINGAIGVFALIGMNFLLSPFSVFVGVNVLTVTIVGILGIPGFVCLYLSRLLL